MSKIVNDQNRDILNAWDRHACKEVYNNVQLAKQLNIAIPPDEYNQYYQQKDVKVKVL
jgi:hypothetical protein